MSQFRAIFFDLDGTLWDSARSAGHAIRAVAPRITKKIPALTIPKIAKGLESKLHELIGERGLNSQEWLDQTEWFDRLFKQYGLEDRRFAQEVASAFKAVRRLTMKTFLFRDVENTLQQLEQDRYILGLITNGHFLNQRETLEALGLTRFFQHIIVSGNEGYHKPDPRIFKRAIQRCGVPAERILYVGDNPQMDIPGAKAVGMRVAWFYSRRKAMLTGGLNPDYTITSVPQVLDIVNRQTRFETPTDFMTFPPED